MDDKSSPKAMAILLMKKHGMGADDDSGDDKDDGKSAAEDILKAIHDNDPDALHQALMDHATLSSGGPDDSDSSSMGDSDDMSGS